MSEKKTRLTAQQAYVEASVRWHTRHALESAAGVAGGTVGGYCRQEQPEDRTVYRATPADFVARKAATVDGGEVQATKPLITMRIDTRFGALRRMILSSKLTAPLAPARPF